MFLVEFVRFAVGSFSAFNCDVVCSLCLVNNCDIISQCSQSASKLSMTRSGYLGEVNENHVQVLCDARAVDTTGLIIISVTCGQEAQSVSDTSGGRSSTRSCWWMVDQIITTFLKKDVLRIWIFEYGFEFYFGFDFDLFIVTDITFCVGRPHFIQIGQRTAEFSRWRP